MGEDRQKGCPLLSWDPVVLGEGVLSRNESTHQGTVGGGTRAECDIFQPNISGTSWI